MIARTIKPKPSEKMLSPTMIATPETGEAVADLNNNQPPPPAIALLRMSVMISLIELVRKELSCLKVGAKSGAITPSKIGSMKKERRN